MDRKEISAFLIDCDSAEFLVYRDEGEKGTVAVGPDGKKYRFSNDELDLAMIRMRDKELDKGDKIREEKEAEKEAAAAEPVAKKRTPAPSNAGTGRNRTASTTSKTSAGAKSKQKRAPAKAGTRKKPPVRKPVHGRTDRGSA